MVGALFRRTSISCHKMTFFDLKVEKTRNNDKVKEQNQSRAIVGKNSLLSGTFPQIEKGFRLFHDLSLPAIACIILTFAIHHR